MQLLPAEIIKKKRNGSTLSQNEIEFMVNGFVDGTIPEYQMSAMLMAIFFQGMSAEEATNLTHTMLHSGKTLDFSMLPGLKVDKHSTGGVGDKTSLILAPIVAAAGVHVPMISGRGLGHTGGTLDKLESIPGFTSQLSLDRFLAILKKNHYAMAGQTGEVCPADKKIYALRDVTATVESLPLICASIMSKKLAADLDGLVLDVKYGSGAFMKTLAQSEELARALMAIGNRSGVRVAALLTSMEQPLGRKIGNALEIEECVSILRNDADAHLYDDTKHLSLELAGHMLWLAEAAPDAKKGYALAEEILKSGKAWKKFEENVREQGGDLSRLPKATCSEVVVASDSGWIANYNTEAIGYAAITLGAGRAKNTDSIDPTAGFFMHHRIGDRVEKGQPLFTMYANTTTRFKEARERLLQATQVLSKEQPAQPALIAKYLLP